MRNSQKELMELPTPFYLFDEAECVSRALTIKQAVKAWNGRICFAIKANPFLIPSLMPVVDKFEVCSPGELEICRKYKVPGEKILFSGVVKTKKDIEKAILYPVDVITLESVYHWELLKEILKERGRNQINIKIMPRLSSGAQFGMEKNDICSILEECRSMNEVSVEGIHYFTGTQKKGRQYEKELNLVLDFMGELHDKFEMENGILEYGPGLATPYFAGDDFEHPYELVHNLQEFLLQKRPHWRVDIELGRYIAATCGSYVTSVVDVKSVEERKYCLVDGGIHQVNYYGSNMAMRTPVIRHLKRESGKVDKAVVYQQDMESVAQIGQEYMVCGSLCTFADILARGLVLKNPQIGDRLVFENIGAYSVTEGSYLFLSHNLPSIYLINSDGEIRQLRKEQESWKINCIDE